MYVYPTLSLSFSFSAVICEQPKVLETKHEPNIKMEPAKPILTQVTIEEMGLCERERGEERDGESEEGEREMESLLNDIASMHITTHFP